LEAETWITHVLSAAFGIQHIQQCF